MKATDTAAACGRRTANNVCSNASSVRSDSTLTKPYAATLLIVAVAPLKSIDVLD